MSTATLEKPLVRTAKSASWRGNPHTLKPFVSREKNGGKLDPRINISGRPKILSEAYKETLARFNPETGKTKAQEIADAQAGLAMERTDAAREIRQATEFDSESEKGLSVGNLSVGVIQVLAKVARQ